MDDKTKLTKADLLQLLEERTNELMLSDSRLKDAVAQIELLEAHVGALNGSVAEWRHKYNVLESGYRGAIENADALDAHNDELLEECVSLRAQLTSVVDVDCGFAPPPAPLVDSQRDNERMDYLQTQLDNVRMDLLEARTKSHIMRKTFQAVLDSYDELPKWSITSKEVLARPSSDIDDVYGTKG